MTNLASVDVKTRVLPAGANAIQITRNASGGRQCDVLRASSISDTATTTAFHLLGGVWITANWTRKTFASAEHFSDIA